MTDFINDNTSSTIYRPVEQHEQEEAFNLWYTVFDYIALPGCYDRYFAPEASPGYQLNDTLGAWYDGKLVSAIHVRRRSFQSRIGDRTYLCACFANVATFEEYRKRGYSRRLLQMALENMKISNDFDVALLQTRVPDHYSALGWEHVPVPAPMAIEWKDFNPDDLHIQWRSASDTLLSDGQRLLDIYSTNPRPYQLDRSPLRMFQLWTNYYWKHEETIIGVLDIGEQGYVVIESPNDVEKICVLEWRAPNLAVEKILFKSAAIEIRRRYPEITAIRFQGIPQYMSLDECIDWAGPLTMRIFPKMMLRNLRLSRENFEVIKAAYSSGEATWWKGDYF